MSKKLCRYKNITRRNKRKNISKYRDYISFNTNYYKERLDILDQRLGRNIGAVKERRRLLLYIEMCNIINA